MTVTPWGVEVGLASVLLSISRARKVVHSVSSLDNSVFMPIFKTKTEGKKRRVFKPEIAAVASNNKASRVLRRALAFTAVVSGQLQDKKAVPCDKWSETAGFFFIANTPKLVILNKK